MRGRGGRAASSSSQLTFHTPVAAGSVGELLAVALAGHHLLKLVSLAVAHAVVGGSWSVD